MDDTRTHAERRQDALDWARNEGAAMAGAHQNGQGLTLSPGSCESISNFLRLIVEVIEHCPEPVEYHEVSHGDPEVDALGRCVDILKPLASTSAASDVTTYLVARFHGRMT